MNRANGIAFASNAPAHFKVAPVGGRGRGKRHLFAAAATTIVFWQVAAAVALATAARPAVGAISRRAFIEASDHRCRECGSLMATLRSVASHPGRWTKWVVVQHRIFLPGVKSERRQRALAAITLRGSIALYHYLQGRAAPRHLAWLEGIIGNSRISGAARCQSAWLLYLCTSRARYGVDLLRLDPRQAAVFAYAKDPKFSTILRRLLREATAARPPRPSSDRAAATALRIGYVYLAEAAFYQRVPPAERGALFGLFRRYWGPVSKKPAVHRAAGAPVVVTLRTHWEAPRVAAVLGRFGPSAQSEFLRALARQGLVLDLAEIMDKMPAMSGEVRAAVRQVAATSHGKLRNELLQFLKSPPKVGTGPWLSPSRRRAPENYQHRGPSASLSAEHHALPPWLAIARPVATVLVAPAAAFARAGFTIRNRCNQEMHVVRLWTSCSCTTAKASGRAIPAGDSLRIRGAVRLAGLAPPLDRYVFVLLERCNRAAQAVTIRLTINVRERKGG